MKTHLSGAGKHHTVCGRGGIAVTDLSRVTCRDCERKHLNRRSEQPLPEVERIARDIAEDVVDRVWDEAASIAAAELRPDETAHACLQLVLGELHDRVRHKEGNREAVRTPAPPSPAAQSRRVS